MKKILSTLSIILIIIGNLNISKASDNKINNGMLKLLITKGVQISKTYYDENSCNESFNENNIKYPDFYRKGCFYNSEKDGYYYLIYSKDLNNYVNSKLNLGNINSETNNSNINNSTKNIPGISDKNKIILDKFINDIKNKEYSYNNSENYISYLDTLNNKISILKNNYSNKKGFSELMNYLSEGVLKLKKEKETQKENQDNEYEIEDILNKEILSENTDSGAMSISCPIYSVAKCQTGYENKLVKNEILYNGCTKDIYECIKSNTNSGILINNGICDDSIGKLYNDIIGKCPEIKEYNYYKGLLFNNNYEELGKQIACTEGISNSNAKNWLNKNNKYCDNNEKIVDGKDYYKVFDIKNNSYPHSTSYSYSTQKDKYLYIGDTEFNDKNAYLVKNFILKGGEYLEDYAEIKLNYGEFNGTIFSNINSNLEIYSTDEYNNDPFLKKTKPVLKIENYKGEKIRIYNGNLKKNINEKFKLSPGRYYIFLKDPNIKANYGGKGDGSLEVKGKDQIVINFNNNKESKQDLTIKNVWLEGDYYNIEYCNNGDDLGNNNFGRSWVSGYIYLGDNKTSKDLKSSLKKGNCEIIKNKISQLELNTGIKIEKGKEYNIMSVIRGNIWDKNEEDNIIYKNIIY